MLTCHMQIPRGGQCLSSRVADFTSEPGFHLVWHGEGHRDQQHRPVGLWVERLHRPGLGDVQLGSSLPEPLQGRRSGGAVIADRAVQGDQLSLGGCQHAADDRSLRSVCQWDKPPLLLCCVTDVRDKTTLNVSALRSKTGLDLCQIFCWVWYLLKVHFSRCNSRGNVTWRVKEWGRESTNVTNTSEYISDLLIPYEPVCTLGSTVSCLLTIPESRLKTKGEAAFAIRGRNK